MDKVEVIGVDLWKKHNVKHFHFSDGEPYVLRFTSNYNPEKLNNLIEDWRSRMTPEQKSRSWDSDFEPHRVGFLRVDSGYDASIVDCVGMSWNQILNLWQASVRSAVSVNERIDYMGMSVLVTTSDNKIVLSKRSKKVETHQGAWHVAAAGMMDLDSAVATRTGFPQVFIELNEEAGVLPQEVTDLKTLGLVKNVEHECAGIEMCFSAKVKLTAEQLIERAKTAKDSWEGKHSCFTREEIGVMLETEKFAPVGAGCLMLALNMV